MVDFDACVCFSGLVSAFPMFGSSFFYIQSSSNSAIDTPCILAVNQNGLNFLSKATHVSLTNCSLSLLKLNLRKDLATLHKLFIYFFSPTAYMNITYVFYMYFPISVCKDFTAVFNVPQEPMVKFPLKEVQSTRTQRPTAGSSYPYVEIMLGDLMSQRITQLQLDQVRAQVPLCKHNDII